ncbi:hypothetical protein R1flu_023719 [Riccia fluitans]|uniref:Uncharacterized protein n=1 Tax=Riccia fluitans TaxID=41844 RepID=A0ABD1XT03_9MARC
MGLDVLFEVNPSMLRFYRSGHYLDRSSQCSSYFADRAGASHRYFRDFIGKPADNLTLLDKWELSMDDKAMDVVGSSQDSQPPQEIVDIVEADVDVVVGTASSWAGWMHLTWCREQI